MVAKKKKRAVKRPARKKVIKKKALRRKIAHRKKIIKKRVVRKIAKRAAKKTTVAKKGVLGAKAIGIITHYFPRVRAAVVKLNAPLKIGDTIKVKGHTTDFIQTITSMQIDRVPITLAKKGQEIGLMVNSRVRQHDIVCQP